ncbi:hypothetical protein Q4566_14585 [Tamlana sp. 2_MG-2023]|nr:hypothetical protein [Tamlana sp. 2_MG-2023]
MAQNTTENSQNYFNLNKAELIQLATETIALKYPDLHFNPNEYVPTVWKNSKKVVVKFRRLICFTPLDKKDDNLDYDLEVDLTNTAISPFDIWGMEKFYIPTSEEQKKIDFVISSFSLPHQSFTTCIIEDANVYHINIDNEQSFGRYVIDKTTGRECEGSIQGNYEPMPADMLEGSRKFPDPLVEILE